MGYLTRNCTRSNLWNAIQGSQFAAILSDWQAPPVALAGFTRHMDNALARWL